MFLLYLMEYRSHYLTVYSATGEQNSGDDAKWKYASKDCVQQVFF